MKLRHLAFLNLVCLSALSCRAPTVSEIANYLDDQPPSIDSFSANPATIMNGQETTLSWSTAGARWISIDPGIRSVQNSGTLTVKPVTTTSYTLAAANYYATVTKTVTVIVNPST